jgi:hypothetical protein
MLVSQIINLASNSELRQLSVRTDTDAIIGFINLGMLELHKRFTLKSEEAIVTVQEGKSIYTLDGTDPDVLMSNAENLLIVIDCLDDLGEPVALNDEYNSLSIMTPSYNAVEVKTVVAGEVFNIIYRSSVNFVHSVSDNVALPPQLLESLLHYIGYRGNSTVTADIKEENNTHYMRFDKSCERVIGQGLTIPDDMESYTFDQRGFV